MPGFFPHTGQQTSAYTPLLKTTFDTFLTDVVNDVGAGTNGWTVHDDQRSNTTLTYYCPNGWFGHNRDYSMASSPVYMTFTQNNATVAGYTGYSNAMYRWNKNAIYSSSLTPNPTQITVDNGSNFYTITSVPNHYTITLDRNFAQTTVNTWAIKAKAQGYVVLKCTSAQKTFYVQLTRPASHADLVMVKTWDDWSNVAHTGVNGGPTEVMRAYNYGYGNTGASPVQYVMWLLPDVFAMWTRGDNTWSGGGGTPSDFMYIGNLTPYVQTDNTCLIQACTNQEYSGWCAWAPGLNGSGGAIMFKGVMNTTVWNDPTLTAPAYNAINDQISRWTGGVQYAITPKGQPYYMNPWRMQFDNYGRFQICELDVYSAEGASNASGLPGGYEGKRGDVKYLKYPLFNPSNFNLVQFGPADDGNTYMLVSTSAPPPGYSNLRNSTATATWLNGANIPNTVARLEHGFCYCNKVYVSGDVANGGGGMFFMPQFFLMPTNI